MILYAKFSNERARRFSIRTVISEENGTKTVLKSAACKEAEGHIRAFEKHYEHLSAAWKKAGFVPNRVTTFGSTAVFEYLEGKLFETTLLAFSDKLNAFARMWKSFFERIDETADTVFSMTDSFREVFGDAEACEGMPAASCADIDLIPANIIESGGTFHVIDYEWTFDFPVPTAYIKWRAAVYFSQMLPHGSAVTPEMLLEMIPVSAKENALFWKMEEHFQSYMLGDHVPLRLLYQDITPGHIDMTHLEQWTTAHQTVTVYFDGGEGLSEEHVKRFPVDPDGFARIEVPLEGLKSFRIDPTEQPCIVRIGSEERIRAMSAKEDSGAESRASGTIPEEDPEIAKMLKTVTINGWRLPDGRFAFPESDPWLHVTAWPQGMKTCRMLLHIENIPGETAEVLGGLLSSRSLKERAKQLIRGRK